MKSILITGCNRGIGLGLVEHVLENYQQIKHIFATCRNPDTASELQALSKKNKNIHVLKADMKIESDIENLVNEVKAITDDESLDILINNAGISSKFARLKFVKYDELIEQYRVNTIAPILMTKEFTSLLKKGNMKPGIIKGVVVNISSLLASIQENSVGGYYSYRASKTALNAVTRSMSIDLKDDNITVVSMNPGWVKTDMGGPNAKISVQESASGIMKFINNLTPEHTGLFYDYNGQQLPW